MAPTQKLGLLSQSNSAHGPKGEKMSEISSMGFLTLGIYLTSRHLNSQPTYARRSEQSTETEGNPWNSYFTGHGALMHSEIFKTGILL